MVRVYSNTKNRVNGVTGQTPFSYAINLIKQQ